MNPVRTLNLKGPIDDFILGTKNASMPDNWSILVTVLFVGRFQFFCDNLKLFLILYGESEENSF